MTVVLVTAAERYVGLSTDTKPSAPATGAIFIESDTRLRYIWTGAAWSVMP